MRFQAVEAVCRGIAGSLLCMCCVDGVLCAEPDARSNVTAPAVAVQIPVRGVEFRPAAGSETDATNCLDAIDA
jgi:hypothetical protein